MRVEIYLNENTRDSFIRGYDVEDSLEHVYDGEKPDNVTLDQIYEANQHLAGREPWYNGRSLSKGDVIILDDDAYAIVSVGFAPVSLPLEIPAI